LGASAGWRRSGTYRVLRPASHSGDDPIVTANSGELGWVVDGLGRRWGGFFMRAVASEIRKFLVSEDGPTAVEYAVMLALIVVVCLTAIGSIGTNANGTFQGVAGSLGGGS